MLNKTVNKDTLWYKKKTTNDIQKIIVFDKWPVRASLFQTSNQFGLIFLGNLISQKCQKSGWYFQTPGKLRVEAHYMHHKQLSLGIATKCKHFFFFVYRHGNETSDQTTCLATRNIFSPIFPFDSLLVEKNGTIYVWYTSSHDMNGSYSPIFLQDKPRLICWFFFPCSDSVCIPYIVHHQQKMERFLPQHLTGDEKVYF